MNDGLSAVHGALRLSHVIGGFAGLALFWLAIAMKKGSPRHRAVGKCFVFCAFYVGGTALVSSIWALVHMDSFSPGISRLAPSRQIAQREQLRFLFSLLAFLSVMTITGALYGWLSIRHQENIAAMRRGSLPFWMTMSAIAALGLAAFGFWRVAFGAPAGAFPSGAYWVPLVLGSFGFLDSVKELRKLYRPLSEPREWLYRHVQQMFGTGIAFHTAFLVFGANRLIGFTLRGPMAIVPWILPTIIGVIAMKWYVDRLKRNPFPTRPATAVTE
jgi:hypothetical protein